MSNIQPTNALRLVDRLEQAIDRLDYLTSRNLVRTLRAEILRSEILIDTTEVMPKMGIEPRR
jgi:hypothetical protein